MKTIGKALSDLNLLHLLKHQLNPLYQPCSAFNQGAGCHLQTDLHVKFDFSRAQLYIYIMAQGPIQHQAGRVPAFLAEQYGAATSLKVPLACSSKARRSRLDLMRGQDLVCSHCHQSWIWRDRLIGKPHLSCLHCGERWQLDMVADLKQWKHVRWAPWNFDHKGAQWPRRSYKQVLLQPQS